MVSSFVCSSEELSSGFLLSCQLTFSKMFNAKPIVFSVAFLNPSLLLSFLLKNVLPVSFTLSKKKKTRKKTLRLSGFTALFDIYMETARNALIEILDRLFQSNLYISSTSLRTHYSTNQGSPRLLVVFFLFFSKLNSLFESFGRD